jgi:hydroxypyruvate isomerase
VANLKWAAAEAPGQSLTIEPLNAGDFPGYFLSDFDLAAEIVDAVAMPNVRLQFDFYHAQAITGDALATWDLHGRRAAHVQIGGYPGRVEPDQGEGDLPAFLSRLGRDGYDGWVSAEYHPSNGTVPGLAWLSH